MVHVLSELFTRLPEVGDLPAPRLAVFIDEAHMLFSDAPASLVAKVERIVRLIRSKGVGVYFVSQSPSDIPSPILAQLGNRVQHAMRAATLQDQRAARVAAETMPINPKVNASEAIMSMGVGEALVSTIRADGRSTPCDVVKIRRPVMDAPGVPWLVSRDMFDSAPGSAKQPPPASSRSPFVACVGVPAPGPPFGARVGVRATAPAVVIASQSPTPRRKYSRTRGKGGWLIAALGLTTFAALGGVAWWLCVTEAGHGVLIALGVVAIFAFRRRLL